MANIGISIGIAIKTDNISSSSASVNNLLLETGDNILLEIGDYLLLE